MTNTNTPIFNENIQTYTYLLDILREKDSSQLIRNDSFSHATVLVENLVNHAKEEILIYSSVFCEAFYLNDPIKEAFESSHKRGVTVKVLVHYNLSGKEDTIGQKKTIKMYLDEIYKDSNIAIKYLDGSKSINLANMKLNNFLVTDKKSFRYEKSTPSKQACISNTTMSTEAVGSLNDNETATLLTDAFNNTF